MAAEVGCLPGHDHEVAGAGRDVLVAAGADVTLGGLVGLDAPDLDVVVGGGRHGSAEEGPGHEGDAHDERGGDHHVVGVGATLLAKRVEAHGRTG